MEIVTKKIERFDLESCSYKDIKSFYSVQCNKRTICLFYKNEKLITILSLEDFYQYCKDEFRFKQYLNLSSNNQIGFDLNSAKAAFEVLGKVTYLIKEIHQDEGIFVYKNIDCNDVAKLIYDKLDMLYKNYAAEQQHNSKSIFLFMIATAFLLIKYNI